MCLQAHLIRHKAFPKVFILHTEYTALQSLGNAEVSAYMQLLSFANAVTINDLNAKGISLAVFNP